MNKTKKTYTWDEWSSLDEEQKRKHEREIGRYLGRPRLWWMGEGSRVFFRESERVVEKKRGKQGKMTKSAAAKR